MKFFVFYLSIILFFFISCNTPPPYSSELEELNVRYGGDWSLSKYDACVLLIVENSERIRNSPDSLMTYIDEIDVLTTSIEPHQCLSFEVRNKAGDSMISATQSDIYVIRPE